MKTQNIALIILMSLIVIGITATNYPDFMHQLLKPVAIGKAITGMQTNDDLYYKFFDEKTTQLLPGVTNNNEIYYNSKIDAYYQPRQRREDFTVAPERYFTNQNGRYIYIDPNDAVSKYAIVSTNSNNLYVAHLSVSRELPVAFDVYNDDTQIRTFVSASLARQNSDLKELVENPAAFQQAINIGTSPTPAEGRAVQPAEGEPAPTASQPAPAEPSQTPQPAAGQPVPGPSPVEPESEPIRSELQKQIDSQTQLIENLIIQLGDTEEEKKIAAEVTELLSLTTADPESLNDLKQVTTKLQSYIAYPPTDFIDAEGVKHVVRATGAGNVFTVDGVDYIVVDGRVYLQKKNTEITDQATKAIVLAGQTKAKETQSQPVLPEPAPAPTTTAAAPVRTAGTLTAELTNDFTNDAVLKLKNLADDQVAYVDGEGNLDVAAAVPPGSTKISNTMARQLGNLELDTNTKLELTTANGYPSFTLTDTTRNTLGLLTDYETRTTTVMTQNADGTYTTTIDENTASCTLNCKAKDAFDHNKPESKLWTETVSRDVKKDGKIQQVNVVEREGVNEVSISLSGATGKRIGDTSTVKILSDNFDNNGKVNFQTMSDAQLTLWYGLSNEDQAEIRNDLRGTEGQSASFGAGRATTGNADVTHTVSPHGNIRVADAETISLLYRAQYLETAAAAIGSSSPSQSNDLKQQAAQARAEAEASAGWQEVDGISGYQDYLQKKGVGALDASRLAAEAEANGLRGDKNKMDTTEVIKFKRTSTLIGDFIAAYKEAKGIQQLTNLAWGEETAARRAKMAQDFCGAVGITNCLVSAICGDYHEIESGNVMVGRGPTGEARTSSAVINAERSGQIVTAGMEAQQLIEIFGNKSVIGGVLYDFTNPNFDPSVLPLMSIRLYHVEYYLNNNAAGESDLRYNLEFRRTLPEDAIPIPSTLENLSPEEYPSWAKVLTTATYSAPLATSKWFAKDQLLKYGDTTASVHNHIYRWSTRNWDEVCLTFDPRLPKGDSLTGEFCVPIVQYLGQATDASSLIDSNAPLPNQPEAVDGVNT